MPEQVSLTINGTPVAVSSGASVAAAVALAGASCRTSVSGEPRSALCGMGICFECRVTINGRLHCRSCQITCEPGMCISTDE
jgi:aerobic-type carbon monoxide dehydrogenase small subunit (CoxS/CutS family)